MPPKVPQGKFYRNTARMRNLIKTLNQTRSHSVRIATLKELYAEMQKRLHRGRTWAANASRAIADAARQGSRWTFRAVGDGVAAGVRLDRRVISRGMAVAGPVHRAGLRFGQSARQAATSRNVAKAAARGQQTQASQRRAAASQTKTPKLTKLTSLVSPANRGSKAGPELSPQQKAARTRAANRAAQQTQVNPGVRAARTGPGNPAGPGNARPGRVVPPDLSKIGQPMPRPQSRANPSSPAGVASKPSARKRTK